MSGRGRPTRPLHGTLPRRLALACGLALLLAGCGSAGNKEDPILRLSSEEALEQGKELLEAGKYRQALQYLNQAFEAAPNSATGREGLLLGADALFQSGGESNFIKAEAKYRDFQNRFPTSDAAAYVQLQIANSLANRKLRPDRDQSATRKARDAYEDVLRLYPQSQYAEEARAKIDELERDLAEHELIVGRFNLRRKLYDAAATRLEALIETYPGYPNMDEVLFILGLAYHRGGNGEQAEEVFARLRLEHAQSPYLKRIPAGKERE